MSNGTFQITPAARYDIVDLSYGVCDALERCSGANDNVDVLRDFAEGILDAILDEHRRRVPWPRR